jgi:hypothetical protein
VPEVHLTFLDGEMVPVETELIDFGHPVIKAQAIQPGSNNEELTVPLSSLKYIVMSAIENEPGADAVELGQVVIHFSDHEVLRAYTGRETLGGPYGVIYNLMEAGGVSQRRIGVPYTAVKSIFKVKHWDGRGKASPKRAKAKLAPGKPAATKPVAKKAAVNIGRARKTTAR